MRNAKLILTAMCILQANLIFAIEISGNVIRKNKEASPASVYINGEEFAVASASGYFEGEIPAGDLTIFAEINLPNGTERSIPRTINVSADTTVQLTVAPLRTVTINTSASVNEYGDPMLRRLSIYEAVTPSVAILQTDVQQIPITDFSGIGSVHAKQFELPEGVYRARLRVGDNSGDYDVWKGFQITSETKEVNISVDDKYSSYPATSRIIDPSKVVFKSDELKGYLVITGEKKAASPSMALSILNLQTGHYTWGSSLADGSFELLINGQPGSEYTIFQRAKVDGWDNYRLGVGTTITAPFSSVKTHSFATEHLIYDPGFSPRNLVDANLIGGRVGGIAQYHGEFDFSQISAGSAGEFTGIVDIVGPSLDDVTISWGSSSLFLEKIVSAEGWIVAANPENSSNFMTVSGLPINGEPEVNRTRIGTVAYSEIEQVSSNLWRAKFVANYDIPSQLSKGRYQIHLKSAINSSVSAKTVFSHHFTADPGTSVLDGRIGEFEIGGTSESKIDIALLVNEYSNGSRGVVPENRVGEFGISPGIITNTHKFIIDGSMPGRKEAASYNLEPFIPLVSWTIKGHQVPLPIKFKFPSGRLEMAVVTPSGVTSSVGPMPFRGTYMNEPFILGDTGGGIASPQQYMKLTTLTDEFDFNFTEYGEYKISLSGTVLDLDGREYSLNGDFNILRAEPLDLEYGVMPGTPYEIGDHFSPQLIIQPGVPAKVEITVTHYPNSDPTLVETTKFSGFANRFGYYDGGNQEYQFDKPGEYRVDVLASHQDKDSVVWAASRTWGGIVESQETELEMRGVKGTESGTAYRQWFVFDSRPLGLGEMNTHMGPPYQTGDVSWMLAEELDRSNTAMTAFYTIFDKSGEFKDRVSSRLSSYSPLDLDNTGMPFVSTTNLKTALGSTINPFFELDNSDDHWAYYYNAAERPGISAREHIGQLQTRNNYWRFTDTYNHQLGNGFQGDNPNDFKFIFGGGVYRIPKTNENHYLAYGSLWVHLPMDDETGGRIMPPFQGASGGPTGGPLLTLLGKEVDIFFHPMGVRPGSILEVGDTAAFSGQIAPTLPSEVSIRVTTPSNETKIIEGTASKIGYFYEPNTNFLITEPGIYDVDITVTHKGMTSSGFVEPPYPVGGILGEDVHSYQFYAVTRESAEAELAVPLPLELPDSTALNFSFKSIATSNDQRMYQTTVMPGYVLSQTESKSLSYSYNAKELNLNFPNLDVDVNGVPRSNVDTITYSFVFETQDQKGQPKYEAQQIVLQGDEIMRADRAQALGGELSIEIDDTELGAGEKLKAELEISAQGIGDLYIVLLMPNGSYLSLGETKLISEIGEVIPFRESINLSHTENLPLVDLILPPGLAQGEYAFYSIFVGKGKNVFDFDNWVSSNSKTWSYN
ncbi:hypothetical protein N9M23_02880 [Gammaproteobacteria bacterium]|nr:hypothetical protein [Gammaproteobacteria bacterium]